MRNMNTSRISGLFGEMFILTADLDSKSCNKRVFGLNHIYFAIVTNSYFNAFK